MFNPGLEIGQIIENSRIVEIFKCGNMGGMRRSKATNTLVLISDYTKGIYHDKWIGGVLHYTGMGKKADQDIGWSQNATLAACDKNGVDVHLFEVINAGEYIYCGRIELAGMPYRDVQPGEDGVNRSVWIFPIRPIPDNDVNKPKMFVFKDMDDYRARGKNVDTEYMKTLVERKRGRKILSEAVNQKAETIRATPLKPVFVALPEMVGKRIKHKSYGDGVIIGITNSIITVSFSDVGEKKLGYEVCMEKRLIEFV
ncbi:MAG: HNH endonuclease [Clostridia bacterium]|nr:HNH endonuclease [Clostridia bacterium]